MQKWIRVELITNYLKENKLSKSEFCRRVGISVSVLNKILTNNLHFRADAILKNCKGNQNGYNVLLVNIIFVQALT